MCKNYCFFSLLDPAAALPPGCCSVVLELEELLLGGVLGVVPSEPLALVEPPAAESFFSSVDEEALDEEEGGVAGVVFTDAEPDTELPEPEGAVAEPDGVVLEPADEEVEPGWLVRETARSPSLSQPVNSPAPSAKDTATAKVESLISVLRGLG